MTTNFLVKNKFNNVTTAYYLMLLKKNRSEFMKKQFTLDFKQKTVTKMTTFIETKSNILASTPTPKKQISSVVASPK